MKNVKNFTQYNESIYSIDWKEDFDEEYCETFDLNPGDKFEMITGTANYVEDSNNTTICFYRGKVYDTIYFSYTKDGTIYKISIDELEEKIVEQK